MNILNDAYEIVGTDYEKFTEAVKNMAAITKTTKLISGNITGLSVMDNEEVSTPDTQAFYILSPENIEGFMEGEKMHYGRVLKSQLGEETLEEMKRTTNLAFLVDKEKLIVSDLAMATLSARAGVSGSATFCRQNLIRNMHLIDGLQHAGSTTTIVYREVDGIKKAFAVMGSQYRYVPQTIVMDIAEEIKSDATMGRWETTRWSINHQYTELMGTFPEVAEDFEAVYGIKDKVPGVIIETSDIGCCSITIKGILKSGASYVITDEIKCQHTLNVTPAKVIGRIKTELFDKFRKLPETLMHLIGIPIENDAIEDIIKVTFKKCFPKKFISEDRRKRLESMILMDFNPEISYTMYDIADKFLSLSEHIVGLNKVSTDEICKLAGKVPYFLESLDLSKEKDEEDFILI